MNNRRHELAIISANEYCKCIIEGKTIRYNQKNVMPNGSFTTWTTIGSANVINGHKYLIHNVYSRPSNDPYGDTDYQVYLDGLLVEGYLYGVNVEKDWIMTCTAQTGTMYFLSATYDNFAGEVFYQIMVIDLTALGLDNITNANEFYQTDLGKYIAKGYYLSASDNAFLNANAPIHFKGVNLWNEQWENGIWYNGTKYTSGYNGFVCSKDKIKVKPNTQYFYFNGSSAHDTYIALNFFDNNGAFIQQIYVNANNSFTTPINCRFIAFYVNDTYGNVYNNDICINEYNIDYNRKYHKYCGTNVLIEGLVLRKGDKYKSCGLDEISYNNLIPNANQDYANSNTDSANANAIVYGANGGVYWAENLTSLGFYSGTFESNTTEIVNIYMSGNDANLYFATDIQMTSGHKYYISFDVLGNNANVVGGLRLVNLRLIDLTQLGLTDLTDKLRIFLQKNYKLPYTTTNKTTKDQLVRTMKEIDLSTLTWTWEGDYWDTDISNIDDIKKDYQSDETPNAIAEKYRVVSVNQDTQEGYPVGNLVIEGNEFTGYYIEITSNDSQNAPSGKMLIELLQPTTTMWQTLDIQDYHEFVTTDTPNIYKLNIDLSDYGILDITSDSGTKISNLTQLNIFGGDGDFCYQDGYIYQKSSDIENAWIYQIQISNAPSRMVSRRTISVESDNGVDLDFTKE